MPRSGWVGLGAAGAAFGLELARGAGLGFAAAVMAGAGLAILGLAARMAGRRLLHVPGVPGRAGGAVLGSTSTTGFALATGMVLIVLRVTLGGGLDGSGWVGRAAVGGASSLPVGAGPWDATVVSVSAPLNGRQRVALRLLDPLDLQVAATLPRYPAVEPGRQVRVSGPLRPPDDSPYGAFLLRTGIGATLRSASLEVVGTSADPAWIVERIRRASGDALAGVLAEPEAGLAAGILVGLRDRVDRQLAADFTTAGVSHVVAISGWNIAIVAGVVMALARGLTQRRRAVLTISAIAGYVAFAGASPSVLRAAAMAAVVLLARLSGRAGRAPAALGWAVTLLLLADPRMIMDAGFQLSTAATAGLIAWATPLASRLAGPDPGWMRRVLAESLGVSLAAQAATLPIVLATFGRLSLVAPLVNLGVVPLVAPAMAAGAVALLAGWLVLGGLPAWVGIAAGLPAWALLGLMVTVVRSGAALPFASVELAAPWGAAAGLAAALGLAIAWRGGHPTERTPPLNPMRWLPGRLGGRRASCDQPSPAPRAEPWDRRRPGRPARAAGHSVRGGSGGGAHRMRRAAILLLGFGLLAPGLVAARLPDGQTRIVMLDVGQGDAILVEGSRGGRVLVDTGPDPDRLLVLLDERLPPWDRSLDAVVITHPHEDHVAGLALLLERYAIARVLDSGMPGPGPGDAAARRAMERSGVEHRTLRTGDRIAVDDLVLDVLWPDPGNVPERAPDSGVEINNVSIVLLGRVDGRSILLTGDAEEGVDPRLLARGVPRLDVLKVAHHGSATATTEALLDATRPALALISVGRANSYGHPAPVTLERLRGHGTTVLRTDRSGSIEVTVGHGRVTARTTRDGDEVGLVHLPSHHPSSASASWGPAGGQSSWLPGSREPTGTAGGLLYHRTDDRPRARGRRLPAPLAGPSGLVPPPRTGRCRGRLVAGPAMRGGRPARPAGRGGDRRAPPRCRQAAPAR